MEKAEIIVLNDFCWCEKFIAWQDLLKILEGNTLNIAAPKTNFSKDLIMGNIIIIICNINLTNTIFYEQKN